MLRKPQKPPEGAKLRDTPDMVAWKKEFEKMKTDEHKAKLKELGLDDDDLEEFEAMEKGELSIEDEMAGPEKVVEEKEIKETPTKKKGKK